MLQDIYPHRFDNHYSHDIKPDSQSVVFHFTDGNVLACDSPENPFPVYGQLRVPDLLVYIFSIDDTKYFLLLDTVAVVPEGFSYQDIKKLRRAENAVKLNIMALFTAFHLWKWYINNRCCGYCGSSTIPYDKERALFCTHCQRIIYPRLNPAVIVGVTDGNRLLITRYADNRGVSYDALVAGYTEIGETLEQTVEREVMEEVGLKVRNIRYYKSQPWGFSGGILAGFYCDAVGDTTVHLDETELSRAVWTEKKNITGQPDDFSLTNEMMIHFKESETV